MPARRSVAILFLGLLVAAIMGLVLWKGIVQSAEQYEMNGRDALSQRNLPLAMAQLENAVHAAPTRVSSWKLLADAACHAGEAERSQTALEEAARLAPKEVHSLCLQLGGRWMAHNRIQPAIHALRLTVVTNPQPPQPYRLLAQI